MGSNPIAPTSENQLGCHYGGLFFRPFFDRDVGGFAHFFLAFLQVVNYKKLVLRVCRGVLANTIKLNTVIQGEDLFNKLDLFIFIPAKTLF